MKKRMIMAATGIAVVVQAAGVSAIDLASVQENGVQIELGMNLEASDVKITADCNIDYAPDQVEKFSGGFVMENADGKYDLKLDDMLVVDSENLYLNVKEGIDTVTTIAGDLGLNEILQQFGITEDWISFPLPEFDKLGIDFGEKAPGKAPEFSEEFLNDLMGIAVVFAPETSDGVTTFKIDNEKILEAAKAADAFVSAHQEELLSFQAPAVPSEEAIKGLDLNAVFEKYINAFGAGLAQASGMDEATAIEQVNGIVTQLTQSIIDSYHVDYTVGGEPLTAEALENLEIYSSVEQALAGQDILIAFSYDANSAEFVFRTDSAETYVIDAAIQEDGTIKVDFAENGELAASGILTATENGIEGTFTNPAGDTVFGMRLELKESGFTAVLTDPNGAEMSVTGELSDTGLKIAAEVPGSTMSVALTGKADDTTTEGGFAIEVDNAGDKVSANGHITVAVPSSPLKIEIPAATDGLEVIKNVAAMMFAGAANE